MKLLLDENISNELKELFESAGFDVLDLKEHSLRQFPDRQIIKLAIKEKRIVISHDRDFLTFMINPKCQAKIVLLIIIPQTEERMMNVGKFLITSEFLFKITKSAIIYYRGDEVNISSV